MFEWFCQVILKEVDETFTDEELNGIISDVSELIMYMDIGYASSRKGKDSWVPTVAPNITMYVPELIFGATGATSGRVKFSSAV